MRKTGRSRGSLTRKKVSRKVYKTKGRRRHKLKCVSKVGRKTVT